ncbi:hypothetical protein SAMN02800692_3509 [Luteibacter sp. UNC138MFCol5.1]|uniref:hypothetical protein n=1 Tax=Luteibacter sp. UNC138MFCol5.1 TaxID=1502774 RepID=UPI0008B4567A|nr:hypothetical protein [Luteibacter sp. UNC138MFCol5.1]SEP06626.1 hypothetical protein SAMN02800692_3509 [Luteibacter sp. UNC138MFCol5.1]
MSRQLVRRARLQRVLHYLTASGIDTYDAQARHLGNAIGGHRLEAMATGSYINTWFARCVEHAMGLTRGWMDSADDDAACNADDVEETRA